MASKKKTTKRQVDVAELLTDLLIVELAKAGVPQLEIRKVVGCDVHRVSRIARYFKQAGKDAAGGRSPKKGQRQGSN